MNDRIEIKDLLVQTIIGINPGERQELQDVLINLTLFTDTRKPGQSDDINDAVNYRTLAKQVIEFTEQSRYFLVEKMAEEIAGICLSDSRIRRVRVDIQKPGAVRFSRSVGVTIERTQHHG